MSIAIGIKINDLLSAAVVANMIVWKSFKLIVFAISDGSFLFQWLHNRGWEETSYICSYYICTSQ